MNKEKRAVLVVSYGCSCAGAGARTLNQIEDAIREAYPDYLVCRAWSSKIIRGRLLEREGIWIPGVKEAVEELQAQDIREIVVQPTHVLDGREFRTVTDEMQAYKDSFSLIAVGAPLLYSDTDRKRVVQVIGEESRPETGKVLVLMGHGTSGSAEAVYREMDERFAAEGYDNIFLGTMEGQLDFEHVLCRIQSRRTKGIVLAPFMITAGKHAVCDLCGKQESSWKSRFEAAGYPVECMLKGLGEYEGIRRIFIEHVGDSITGISGKRGQ